MTEPGLGGYRAPRTVIVPLGAKLIGLDSVLPLAMQLKAEDPDLAVHFLCVNAGSLPAIRANYILYEGMRATGGIHVLSPGPGRFNRLRAAARLARWAAALRLRPGLLLAYHDLARLPFWPLARACRAGGGLAVLHVKPPYPFHPLLRQDQNAKLTSDATFADPGDRFLCFHPGQTEDYAPFTSAPPTIIGTPRLYPAWLAHLEAMRARVGILDAAGRPVEGLAGRPVLAGFYIGGGIEIPSLRTPARDQFLTFLEAARAALPQAKILIKPHPLCDLAELDRDLARFADLDVSVTFAHPQMLARVATAAVLPNGSSVIDDMYASGVPVIDVGDYVGDMEGIGMFPNRGRVPADTPEAMRRVLGQIAAGEALPTPEADHLVQAKPPSLLDAIYNGPSARA